MATVVVSGALANKYGNAGAAWERLSYVLGFRQLGLEVWFLEELNSRDLDAAKAGEYFDRVVDHFGLANRSGLIDIDGNVIAGSPTDDLVDVAEAADLLVNVSGNLRSSGLFHRFRRRAFVDVDPGYTQMWHALGESEARLEGYDVYFTIGENVGGDACLVPTCGIDWQATRPPVVLDQWPAADDGGFDRFTTIASWRGAYGRVEFGGRTYGLKAHEFRKFADLPQRSSQAFEIALDIEPADARDRALLEDHGWRLVDPREAAGSPEAFRIYIQDSGAEFSVAQSIYVDTACGWFSERTTRYLASGKPALVQETGFSRQLPVGEGLLSFRTVEEAVTGAESIAADYEAHCRAARAVAEQYFDSDLVLARLLEQAGVS